MVVFPLSYQSLMTKLGHIEYADKSTVNDGNTCLLLICLYVDDHLTAVNEKKN